MNEAAITADPNPPDPPVIEPSQIDGLVAAAGLEGAMEILAAFWRSSDSLLAGLKDQLSTGDAAEAGRTAHALKGSALNVGAVRFSDTMRAIEERCRGCDAAGALAFVEEGERRYAETAAAFKSHIDSLR